MQVHFFFSKTPIKLKQLWIFVISAEFVLLLVPIFKILWFYFFEPNYNLEDVQYFYLLSALNIVGYKGLEPWLIYPFQVLNLFELAYCLILAYFIGKATGILAMGTLCGTVTLIASVGTTRFGGAII